MNKKTKDLLIVLLFYIISFGLAVIPCFFIEGLMLKVFVFDILATVLVFVFSAIMKNSSVYDPYWSVLPMIVSVWLLVDSGVYSLWTILFTVVFNIWSIRLTVNWMTVFTDFSYEDWRYRKFRSENKGLMWFIINFFGIHMVPTLVVFAGMLPMFVLYNKDINLMSVLGIAVMLFGVALEFFADRQMHAHLSDEKSKGVCQNGLWKYSRHPNYLGEMSFWVGVYICQLISKSEYWYYGCGALSVIILFNVVSVPLMEKRQLSRRSDYAEYKKHTSRVLLMPRRKMCD
ncbi:MAG: DUF1295 domain-containing protein [Lachnospiraceae bacterium]|nr:DUF1295 domain-containing protein [Lachnospiraceae bacterium]